jgi:hypothetical protein
LNREFRENALRAHEWRICEDPIPAFRASSRFSRFQFLG